MGSPLTSGPQQDHIDRATSIAIDRLIDQSIIHSFIHVCVSILEMHR